MKKQILLSAVLACISVFSAAAQKEPVDYVNPFVGTTNYGTTNPGALTPHGMMSVTPFNVMGVPEGDKDKDKQWWSTPYEFNNKYLTGFAHVNLSGVGCPELGSLLLMPTTGKLDVDYHNYGSFYQGETANPGYYTNILDKYNVKCELTATPRTSMARFTFPAGQSNILLNLGEGLTNESGATVRFVNDREIEGTKLLGTFCYNPQAVFPIYFVMRINKVPAKRGYWKMMRPMGVEAQWDDTAGKYKLYTAYTKEISGDDIGVWFTYDTTAEEVIEVSMGVSFVSIENARLNLEKEQPFGTTFDKLRAEARKKWNDDLSRIKVEGGTEEQKGVFYTAMYHTMVHPNILQDVSGQYPQMEGDKILTTNRNRYTVFSLWDTYRAAHPLFTYTEPQRVNDMVKSFIAFYEQNGRLPVWNFWGSETDMMIGYHAVPVIVDAYLKGIGDFDAEKALEACVATANLDDYRGIGLYKKLGYIPYNIKDEYNAENWSLSKTLEYAFDDYCIAEMARKMGRTQLADEFYKRSQNYRNVFNPASSFMQPIDDKGVFQPNFSPDDYTAHICESNGWQYFWSVQQDIKGLIALTGGKDRFTEKLDSMFTYIPAGNADLPLFSTGMIGQYAHGNEPSHHVIYLYNKVRQPWKTQKYAAQVMHDLYFNAPAGLCGNEDCGQMSAWYVFSAMGFYPVNPVSGEYEIGTPLFPEIQMHLDNGKTFTVLAPGVSRENIYIQSVKVNGQPYDKSYITHRQIMDGATVEFEMGPEPGNIWYR